MMKRLALIGIAVVLALLVGLRLLSSSMEGWYEEALHENSTEGQILLEKVSYQPGWFTTQAVTRVRILDERLVGEGGQPIEFSLHHVLRPGPVVGTTALAELRTHPMLAAPIAEMAGNRNPLTISMRFGLGGSSTTKITGEPVSGEVELDGIGTTAIRWGGADGTIRTDGEMMDVELEIPELSVSTVEQVFRLKSLAARAKLTKGSHDIWAGSIEGGVETLELSEEIGAAQIRFQSIQEVDPEDNASLHLESRAGSLRARGEEIRDVDVALVVEKVDAELLSTMMSGDETFDEEGSQLEAVRGFLIRSPSVTLEPLRFTTADGEEVRGRIRFGFRSDGLDSEFHPIQTLVRLQMEADADAPKKFVERVLAALRESGIASGSDDRGTPIENLQDDGWLVADGDRAKISLAYGDSKVVLNGQSRPDLFRAMIRGLLDTLMAG